MTYRDGRLDRLDLQEMYEDRRRQFVNREINAEQFYQILCRLGYTPAMADQEIELAAEEQVKTFTGELRDWYKTPMSYGKYLYWGHIFNDVKKRWPDGYLIHTSYVVKEEHDVEGITIHTLNSTYRLLHKHKRL